MSNQIIQPHKSSIGGLNANVMALICYISSVVVGWIPVVRYVAFLVPLVLFFMEKESGFVKFHAMQSFVLHLISAALTFLVSVVLGGILGIGSMSSVTAYAAMGIAGILGIVTFAISAIIFIFAVIAMIKAYGYKEYHIPLVGGIAAKFAGQR